MDDPEYDRLSIKMATAKAKAKTFDRDDDENSSIESIGSDNDQLESVDGGDMASSSLTTIRNQNKAVRKKGRKHKLKLLCSSPIDVTISVPIEIHNVGSSSSLRNDTGSVRSLRSLSDSFSDEYTMDEIECDFKQLINKHSSNSQTLTEEDIQQEQLQNEEEELIEPLVSPTPYGYERRITLTLSPNHLADEIISDETCEHLPNKELRPSLKCVTNLPTLQETVNDQSHSEYTELQQESKEDEIIEQNNSSKANVILSPIEEVSLVEADFQNLQIQTEINQPDLSILNKYNLTQVQKSLIEQFFIDYSQDSYLNAVHIKKLMSVCFQQRNDVRLTDSDVNRIVYVADRDGDGKLSLSDFVELLCLCFAKKNDLYAILLVIIKNRSYGNDTSKPMTGYMEANDANDFVNFVNKFYGRQFYFISFFETVSYEDLALELSEDLYSAIFF